MTIFWILAAGFMGLAILFVITPLLRQSHYQGSPDQDALNMEVFRQRLAELDGDLATGFLDQDQHAAARQDLERELLYDLESDSGPTNARSGPAPWLAAILALAIPVGAVALYLGLGDSEIIPRMESAALAPQPSRMAGADGQTMPPLDVLAQALADRMEQNPDNLDGWLMLGRTYYTLNQRDKALAAIERAFALAPDQANVIIAYAEALAANSGNSLEGRPAELIQTALKIEPANASGRWLSGMLSYQRERFAEAATTWQGILDEMDPAGNEAQEMRQMISEAEQRAGGPTATATVSVTEDAPAAAPESVPTPAQTQDSEASDSTVAIRVSVSLDPSLASQADANDSLFIYARAAAGPPMPLAAQRLKVSDLPASVTLDDSMAMMPTMRLSAFPQVIVGARVSKSGQAMPQPGDLEGQVGPIDSSGNAQVSVSIDQVRP